MAPALDHHGLPEWPRPSSCSALASPSLEASRAWTDADSSSALTPLLDAAGSDPLALIRFGFEGWGQRTLKPSTTSHTGSAHLATSCPWRRRMRPWSARTTSCSTLGVGRATSAWSLGQSFGADRTVGLDLSLFELWAAHGIAENVQLVCGDATALPFRSGSFGLVISSDVLSFVTNKWGAAREGLRLLTRSGTLAVTAVKSSLQHHVYAGMPLTPTAWGQLVSPLSHCVFADDRILERYFAGEGLAVEDPGVVSAAKTITVLAGASDMVLRTTGFSDDWPHARGPWP